MGPHLRRARRAAMRPGAASIIISRGRGRAFHAALLRIVKRQARSADAVWPPLVGLKVSRPERGAAGVLFAPARLDPCVRLGCGHH